MSSPLSVSLNAPVVANPQFQVDVGSVLVRTVTIWGRNLVAFLLVGLAVSSPVLIGFLLLGFASTRHAGLERGLDIVANLLTTVLTGAVTYGVFQALHERPAQAGEILRKGVAKWGALWVTSILMGLGIGLGFCALLIPGLVLMTRWWVAVPVAVIESLGPMQALSRSSELTEGNRWRVFALVLVTGVAVIVSSLLLGALVGVVEGAMGRASDGQLHAWTQLLLQILTVPVNALAAVAPAIVYHDLRVGKEGADIDELLRVFD